MGIKLLEKYNIKSDASHIDKKLSISTRFDYLKNDDSILGLSIVKNYSVYELNRRYKASKIVLDSDFQRDNVWSNRKKSELIESVLMGLPLPVFYFRENEDGVFAVIDGKQRLTALFEYLNGKNKITGVSTLKNINNLYFDDLKKVSSIKADKIEDYQIIAYVIPKTVPDQVIFDIFERVNRTGMKLNKQEIRNAVYQGRIIDLIHELLKNEYVENVLNLYLKNDNRMKKQYFLSRILAMYLYENKLLFFYNEKNMKYEQVLNLKSEMEVLIEYLYKFINDKKVCKIDINKIKNIIIDAFKKVSSIFDDNAFRLNLSGDRKYPLNLNLGESIIFTLTKIQEPLKHKNVIIKKFDKIKTSSDFIETIIHHRDSIDNIEDRLSLIDDELKEYYD